MKRRQKTSQPQLKSSIPSAELAPNPVASSKNVGPDINLQASVTSSKPTDPPTKTITAPQIPVLKADMHQIFQSASWDSIVQASEPELSRGPQPHLYEFLSKPSASPQHFAKQISTPPATYTASQVNILEVLCVLYY